MQGYWTLKGGEIEVDGVPETIAVLPLGHVHSSKGNFKVDAESFAAMKAEIARRGVDVVIDYEHQTLKGVQAPAAGWIKELLLKDDCILARVEWTPAAAEYLRNKEYRYLSPVISVRKSDGKAMGLHSLALTNTPAISGMRPIVNSESYEEGDQELMEELIKKLAELLGLGEDATPEQLIGAVTACLDENKTLKAGCDAGASDDKVVANKAVCELLDLKAGSPAADVAAKIMALKGGTINGVNVLEELAALKKQNAQRSAEDSVLTALKAGKITPAQKEWAESYALSDPTGFAAFMEKAPQAVPMGEIKLEDGKARAVQHDEATMLACKQLGVSEDDLKKYAGKE